MRIIDIGREVVEDIDPDASYLRQPGWETRRAAYHAGDFHYVGVRAAAWVEVRGLQQVIRTGGVWSIESDSDEDYFDDVYAEERHELTAMLAEMGFDVAEMSA